MFHIRTRNAEEGGEGQGGSKSQRLLDLDRKRHATSGSGKCHQSISVRVIVDYVCPCFGVVGSGQNVPARVRYAIWQISWIE